MYLHLLPGCCLCTLPVLPLLRVGWDAGGLFSSVLLHPQLPTVPVLRQPLLLALPWSLASGLSQRLFPPLVPSFSLCLCSVLCRSSPAAGCLLGIKRRPLISVFNFLYVSVSSSCVTSAPHVCQLELQVVVSCRVTDCSLSWVFSCCPAHFILLGINVRRGLLNPIARSLCPEE